MVGASEALSKSAKKVGVQDNLGTSSSAPVDEVSLFVPPDSTDTRGVVSLELSDEVEVPAVEGETLLSLLGPDSDSTIV